jgi:hypothetical protein
MIRAVFAATILLAATALVAQQPSPPAGSVPSADQKAVVPGNPDQPSQPNQTIELRPGPAPIGPPTSATGNVVNWEEGRNVTVRFGDGSQVTYPVAGNIIFPPDIRIGGRITVTTVPIEGGGIKVTGLTTVMPPAQTIPIGSGGTPTVSGPKNQTEGGGPRPALKAPAAGAAAKLSTQATSMVQAYERGKTITVTRPDGGTRTYRLARHAVVPADLAPGKQVSIETRTVNHRRYVTKVSYKAAEITITNTK